MKYKLFVALSMSFGISLFNLGYAQNRDTVINTIKFDSVRMVVSGFYNKINNSNYVNFEGGLIVGLDNSFGFPYYMDAKFGSGVYSFCGLYDKRKRYFLFVYNNYSKIIGDYSVDHVIKETLRYMESNSKTETEKIDILITVNEILKLTHKEIDPMGVD